MTTAGENGPTTWVDDDASPRLGLLLLPLAFVGLGASSIGDRLSGAFGPPYSEITSCLVESLIWTSRSMSWLALPVTLGGSCPIMIP